MIGLNVEIVVSDNRFLIGRAYDRSLTSLGQRLLTAGLPMSRVVAVAESPVPIREAVEQAAARSRLVFVSGRPGPDGSDPALAAVAGLLNRRMVVHPPTLRRIEQLRHRSGWRVPASVRRQACVLQGARLFPGSGETAPACLVEWQGATIVTLPGTPVALRAVLPSVEVFIRARFARATVRSARVRITGEPEQTLTSRVERALRHYPSVSSAYYPSNSGVDVLLTASSEDDLLPVLKRVREAAGRGVYEVGERNLSEVVGFLLGARRLSLATAESCTAGLLAAQITDVAGSSEYFKGGIIAYSDAVKRCQLGVADTALRRYGAVSRSVARLMAIGVARLIGADVGIGITGIAGPGGGTPDKPVGRVFTAVAVRGRVTCERLMLGGKRRAIREQAVAAALDLCRRALESDR